MSKYKRYWELQGKRRPFPPLYEAVKMYGAENVFFDKPQYEKPGQCPWCGGERKISLYVTERYYVRCASCGFTLSGRSQSAATANWNRLSKKVRT